MINRQIPHVHQVISEFLELHKYRFDRDYYRLFCFDRFFFRVLFAYFDESTASKRVYKPKRSWNTLGLTPI